MPIADNGVYETSSTRIVFGGDYDTFFYRVRDPHGAVRLVPVPKGYVLAGEDHGGFDVDAGWFIFIGPPELRDTVEFADWDKWYQKFFREHGFNHRGPPEPLPTPGRMTAR